MSKKKALPGTSEAERWLDADTFIYKGKVYRVALDFKARRYKKSK